MSRSFAITTPTNELDLAGKASAEVTLTVTNQTERALRGTARLVPIDPTRKEWLKIVDGEEERAFPPKGTHQYKVKVELPKDTPKGAYTFRMDFVSSDNPDEDSTPGPAIAVKVADATPAPAGKFPLWIIPVIAVVLIGVGIGIYFAVSGGSKDVEVPDLAGKTVEEAGAALADAGLTSQMGEPKDVAGSKPGTIVGQAPAAGEKVPKGSAVEIHPQAAAPPPLDEVVVPAVTGKTIDGAKVLLYEAGFSVKIGNAKFTGGAPGMIVAQVPAGGAKAARGAVIELLPEKESVLVPSVTNRTLSDAVLALKGAKLDWQGIEEVNSTAAPNTVLKQVPPPNARAEQDSVVKLTIAKAPGKALPPIRMVEALPVAERVKLATFFALDKDYVGVKEISSEGHFYNGQGPVVTLSYGTQSGGAKLEVTPLTGGKPTPGGSPLVVVTAKEGSGEAKVSVRIYGKAVVTVDRLLVRLVGADGAELHRMERPVSLTFHPLPPFKGIR